MSRSVAQLAWPFALSLALHLGAGWWLSPTYTASAPKTTKATALTVSLPGKDRAEAVAVAPTEPVAVPQAPPTAVAATDAAGQLTQKARFLEPPDLSPLEEVPVLIPGSLSIRLEVSRVGRVERVTVLKSDPIPKELLDGLIARFEDARLAPALAGSEAVASTLDLVIRFEPAPTPLRKEP